MRSARKFITQAVSVHHRLLGTRRAPRQGGARRGGALDNCDEGSLTSFQLLLLHILQQIEAKRYRKCGELLHGDQDGERPRDKAFRFVCTIEDVVHGVQKEVDFGCGGTAAAARQPAVRRGA